MKITMMVRSNDGGGSRGDGGASMVEYVIVLVVKTESKENTLRCEELEREIGETQATSAI